MTIPTPLGASGGADDALDPAVLADLRRRGVRNPALLQAIISAFQGEGPALLTAMRAAAAEGSATKLRSAAHALKGAAAAVGARRLADLCVELETMGRAGGVAGAEALLAVLEPQLLRACQALQAECPRRE